MTESFWPALRAREPQGLEEAIGRYSPYVAGVLRKVLGQLGTQEDLEELSSDVFVALWQSAEGLREDSDLKLWLGVVARNRALKHLRALRLELPWRTPSSPARSPPGFGSARRKPSWCARRCCGLSPTDRDIFLRHYYWRQTVARIARRAGHEPLHGEKPPETRAGEAADTLKKEDA